MRYCLFILLVSLLLSCDSRSDALRAMESELREFVAAYPDARIGVAVITENGNSGVAMSDTFPMMSVYKFPIALALSDRLSSQNRYLDEERFVPLYLLPSDTYSPMLKDFAGRDTVMLTLREILRYSLQESDNNASDLILNEAGGAQAVESFLCRANIHGIEVKWSEEEMKNDIFRSYENVCTPEAIASLFYEFATKSQDTISSEIKSILESCLTGGDRIIAPLVGKDCAVGHKTGTGFTLPVGRLMALNDAGYIILTGGKIYALAVMIADSGYSIEESSAIIAGISDIVFKNISH